MSTNRTSVSAKAYPLAERDTSENHVGSDQEEDDRKPAAMPSHSRRSSHRLSPATARNPFYERPRDDNFPDFEIALKPGRPDGMLEEEDVIQDTTIDFSVCSSGNDILNMSIGARAALNEHLRHVAKFGIDGEMMMGQQQESSSMTDSGHHDVNLHPDNHHQDDVLDEHWENLLDLSSKVNSSGEVGSSIGVDSPPSGFDNIMYNASRHGESDDAIEVMTDISHDYFNSSRVQLLTTPERYHNKRRDMVVTRDDESLEALPFDEDEHDDDAFPPTLSRNILNDSHEEEHQNETLHSFNPNDISEVRRSPDTSFLSQEQHHLDLNVSALSAISGNNGMSPMRSRDASFLSTPEHDAIPASRMTALKPSPFSAARITPQRLSTSNEIMKPAAYQKENVSPENSNESSNDTGNSGPSIHSAVSSFFEEAKSMAMYVANELEQSFNGLETLQMDFMRAMDISGGSRNDTPPSPISHEESNNSSSQDSAKRKKEHQHVDDHHLLSKMKNEAILGRKRYRTVVPRRLYHTTMDTTLEEEEQDSFLAVRSNPETQRNDGESILPESPAAVAARTTF